ncbi:hypothetical protein K493DRAFT_334137 [Basidiobolus meristosporus CBS 931.73]|uniref:CBM21 domain-containing protein n=1 Tax=Basidiobolus meristosporus CBS 931.73 TaxID=1314790 RepID=A0A1Y1Z0Y0_9FUNG|nr:hypothetical protein K493DRAFT_334137 [Basidiobolus meristosporus CBS 931.73]|eukprot:ORY03774.1 hypothetical protein K493DRAFT_334137 [Basidiobolus meristosporus CBS 931.73]
MTSNGRNAAMTTLDSPSSPVALTKKRVSLISSPVSATASGPHRPNAKPMASKHLHKAIQRPTHACSGPDIVSCGITSNTEIDTLRNLALTCGVASSCARSHQSPRKKSGEVVKSALKYKESNPPQPMSSIPSKFVHFDAQLEYIKLFMKGEKPQTISNPGSDVEDGISSDDDFYDQEEVSLSIRLPNFSPPMFSYYCPNVVSVDSISLSEDKKSLVGSVQVANLAYHKNVSVRYTFDFWQSTEEVAASFKRPTAKEYGNHIGVDEFSFSIDLKHKVSTELGSPKKTLFFAIKYVVNEQEHWDNNDGMNYHVEFVLSKTKSLDPWDIPAPVVAISKSQPIDIMRSPGYTQDPIYSTSPESPLASFKSASAKKLSSRYDFGASLSALLVSEASYRKKQFGPSRYFDIPTSDQLDRQYEPYNHSPAYSASSPFPQQMLNHEYDTYSSASVESPFGNNSWEEPTYLIHAYDTFARNHVSNPSPSNAPKLTTSEINPGEARSDLSRII